MKEIKIEYKNRLPHIAPIGACFFVTFRLGDSLSQEVIKKISGKMKEAIAILDKEKPEGYKKEILRQKKKFFKKYDHQLDEKPYGACYLNQDKVAKVVSDKIKSMDGEKYDLIAYCIMPNHVHLLLDFSIQIVDKNGFYMDSLPENYTQLHQIMKAIKGGSAYEANKVLDRIGTFWYKDSYDHFVRNEKEYWNIINYIINNPVKAGLVEDWKDYKETYISSFILEKLLDQED